MPAGWSCRRHRGFSPDEPPSVDAVRLLREQHRFMKGVFAWVGFPSCAVPYDRAPRHAGTTKWSYWKLWNFALEGITASP